MAGIFEYPPRSSSVDSDFRGLPFNGPLGDGRHGAISITGNTTATATPPIYQCTSLNVDSGVTWTAKADNPGGFIIACQGTATIAGTISVVGRGALQTASLSGLPGRGFAGPGGSDTTNLGGPVYLDGYAPLTAHNNPRSLWGTDGGATLAYFGNWLRSQAMTGMNAVGDASGTASIASTRALFDWLWATDPKALIGYGSSGGADGAGQTTLGHGGGFFFLLCNELNLTGTINATGGSSDAASGGGGGGQIVIGYRTTLTASGTLTVDGGTGTSAGNGAVGYSKIFDMRC